MNSLFICFNAYSQQIEELEEQHRQSEAARLLEQEGKEKELDQKRQQLDQMHQMAEILKKEAEEVTLIWPT